MAALLRRESPSTKIFALTAYKSFEDRQKSKDAGIDLHLGKPVTKEKVFWLLGLTVGEE